MKIRTAPGTRTSKTDAGPLSGEVTTPAAGHESPRNGASHNEPSPDTVDVGLLLNTLIAFKEGNFNVRLPVDRTGVAGKVNDTLNEIFRLNGHTAAEFARISSAVGKEGKISQRASIGTVSG
ncbi:MAG: hypothetical protein M3N93_15330, partial [Acidobacteriota bacterium]|nr:hypothetical protein [Acidobacteriota bacterium]